MLHQKVTFCQECQKASVGYLNNRDDGDMVRCFTVKSGPDFLLRWLMQGTNVFKRSTVVIRTGVMIVQKMYQRLFVCPWQTLEAQWTNPNLHYVQNPRMIALNPKQQYTAKTCNDSFCKAIIFISVISVKISINKYYMFVCVVFSSCVAFVSLCDTYSSHAFPYYYRL